ncbi:MAG TPA: VWA domain-containing protein [Pyrinomonadaceae bacterium]|nr:VWA domain-containing protein [Pyrinomonadaceae bacterium]
MNRIRHITLRRVERRSVAWIGVALLLLLAMVWLTAPSAPGSLIASAQSAPQKKKRTGRASPNIAKPAPSPTPKSWMDALGEPPPPPPPPKPSPTPKVEAEISPGDVISVTTTEVMLPVTVRDEQGRFASELTRTDFRVFEDGQPQPLSDVALRKIPVDVVLMVDSSSSVANNLDDFRRAAAGFAAKLAAEDRLSLIKFDDRVHLLQDWTQSRFQFQRSLGRIEPGMFTRFNDALLLAARQQFTSTKSRRAAIVLSDGIDSGRGTTSLEGALRALLEAQVVVYVVSNTEIARAAKRAELDSLLGGADSVVRFNQLRIEDLRQGLRVLDQSETQLAQIAAATGGRLYRPLSFQALDSTYAEVAEELRHQYALYYTPLNKQRDGSFRRVRVETTDPSFETHTRVGYFAPKS